MKRYVQLAPKGPSPNSRHRVSQPHAWQAHAGSVSLSLSLPPTKVDKKMSYSYLGHIKNEYELAEALRQPETGPKWAKQI